MISAETRADHSSYVVDASGFSGWADRVLVLSDEAQVVEILNAASASNTPVTPVGAGYGLTGGRVAQGGWVLSLEKFRRWKSTRASAAPGRLLSLLEVRDAARPSGQFYAPDTTEIISSVGGTIATNASGSRSFGTVARAGMLMRSGSLSWTDELSNIEEGTRLIFLFQQSLFRT